jgi:hypothetical protein
MGISPVQPMRRDHRTLQQSVLRIALKLIQVGAWMESEGDYDGRNEASVKLCKKIVDQFGDDMESIPYI